jgi:LPPG:FO 2-phospho-L-lactate transferase
MKVVALSGGVGGARLLDGLARALPPGALTAIVNTGDDFVHLGLNVSPDLDTVMYTLAGLAHEERGWGLAEESFAGLSMIKRYGGADWFALGDRDLATHLLRTEALRAGESLSSITARLCAALGVAQPILPMSDAPVSTVIDTERDGSLHFQQWFVRRRAEPRVRGVRFEGDLEPAPGVIGAIDACNLVVIGPSNPYVSVDPILSLRGVRDAIARRPVVALSPIVAGAAIKGPLASMIPDLAGEPPTPGAVVRHYRGLVRAVVVERGDEVTVGESIPVLGTSTIMRSRDDRLRLAREVLSVFG